MSERGVTDAAGEAMEGGGFYNRHSSMQAAGIGKLIPAWERLLREVKLDGQPVVIADYGSSQGRNSMAPMRMAIEEVRNRIGENVPIDIVHTDLPSNDFAALFNALESEPDSYMRDSTGVYPSAIGRSYFQPIFRPGGVTIGWNSWTVHWLSGEKIYAPDHFLLNLSKSQVTQDALRRRQGEDWQRFLECRSVELASGGKLLSAFVTEKDDHIGWEWLCGELWHAALDACAEGILTRDELSRVMLPAATRRAEDINAIFGANGAFAGLTLDSVEVVEVPDPIWAAYQEDGDADKLGKAHANSLRAWSGPSLAACISHRSDGSAVVDRIYEIAAQRLASAPQPHTPYLAVVSLTKT